jgi:hypothetical protein
VSNVFIKMRQKIVILPTSLLFIFLFSILTCIISIPTITITPTTLANHAYADLASTDKASPSVAKSLDSNQIETLKANLTQIKNQDNSSDKMKMEFAANNTIVSKNQGKNETSFSFNITDSINITSSLTNTEAQASEVTGDFNGDGFSDLAIGVPGEDVPFMDEIVVNAGAVNVIYGTSNGLNATALSPDNGRADQIFTQASPRLFFSPRDNNRFGSALATGDFNKDGFSDLAIGVPGFDRTQEGIMNSGIVLVIYGSSDGLDNPDISNDFWEQANPNIEDMSEVNDGFGSALATGDFNKDGFSDLAIGVPNETIRIVMNILGDAGAVNVIYGSSGGLDATTIPDELLIQFGDIEFGDLFGSALATGDFNKDGFSDLAIGVPGEAVGIIRDAGQINVVHGSSDGLRPPGERLWHQNIRSIEDDAEIGDLFGSALATGDFNKDGFSDLAIGVPGEGRNDRLRNVGAVNVIYGTSVGLFDVEVLPENGHLNQLWAQDSIGIEDEPQSNDGFGSALATGDFNKDRISDLAIGVPNENVDNITAAGAVNVIYGSIGLVINSGGLSTTVPHGGFGRADQIWTQNTPQIEDDAEANDQFGRSLG